MSYQKKLVRAMNQPIPGAWSSLPDVYDPSKLARVTNPDWDAPWPGTSLPMSSKPESPQKNTPEEELCLKEILKGLFKYFQLRGYIMTAGRRDGKDTPTVISSEDHPEEYYCFETLEEIIEAGPEYLSEFYDFTTELIHMML